MSDGDGSGTADQAVEAFIAELQHWRDVAGLSQKALARRMAYDPSYVSKIEGGAARPTEAFAARADDVLRAGGALRRRWQEYDFITRREGHPGAGVQEQPAGGQSPPPGSGLIVEHDDDELRYDGSTYLATMRRKLHNPGPDPAARYLIRISVDRHPGDPQRSNQLYRERPLTWDALNLQTRCGPDPMAWTVKHDRDAFKEIWLLFENEHGKFPLYPGETTWIEYRYQVSDEQWGHWFQRAVRLPTKRLSVTLRFPADLDPAVWGMETSMSAEASPFRTAIQRQREDSEMVYSWATEDPPLHARYRLEWDFRARRAAAQAEEQPTMKPSDRMRALGIVQEGDPILGEVAQPFDLPAEAEDARRVIAQLQSALERVAQVHNFSKGLGLAAPQIGISRAAAIVRPPNGPPITLLNPTVIEESMQTDEQYEGCLSFFDIRVLVPRPLGIQVQHQDVNGQQRIIIFETGVARLVAHEIDHLHGRLCTSRMRAGVNPIPVEEYRKTGFPWDYTTGEHAVKW